MIEDLKAELKELEQAHVNIEVRASAERLGEILADDFREIGSSGIMLNKEDCLVDGVVLSEMSIHNYEVEQLAPDIVLATYYIKDETRERNTLRSSIWKRINNRWQLYFHQGTVSK
ncbi:DUF4440 domain-containing protein [Salimicrobium jeotgali]|nr:DUF4440 domain-containing protein [Salimicrobium jeotgali]AKG05797.1 DUF4440 domain-containing protein [Salimicrobium jeotgali]MBM7695688.1 hypothetical protein [Salimicrobium jeotgali]